VVAEFEWLMICHVKRSKNVDIMPISNVR